jgi:hypothetical protein
MISSLSISGSLRWRTRRSRPAAEMFEDARAGIRLRDEIPLRREACPEETADRRLVADDKHP